MQAAKRRRCRMFRPKLYRGEPFDTLPPLRRLPFLPVGGQEPDRDADQQDDRQERQFGGALQARFLKLSESSSAWPCDFPSAQSVILKPQDAPPPPPPPPSGLVLCAESDLEPAQIQDLGDIVPKLLDIKKKTGLPMWLHLRIEIGDGKTAPPENAVKDVNTLLKDVTEELQLK